MTISIHKQLFLKTKILECYSTKGLLGTVLYDYNYKDFPGYIANAFSKQSIAASMAVVLST